MIGSQSIGQRSSTTATARFLAVAVVAFLHTAHAPVAFAQVIRGTARASGSERPLERARIVAMREDGRGVGEATTDDAGRFLLRVDSRGEPFLISITRIGLRPTLSSTLYLGPRDTLDVDFSVAEEGIVTDTVKITSAPTLNATRLAEGNRRGWRVLQPAEVEKLRERANTFEDLLRSSGNTGLIIGRRDECIRSTRTNRCLLIVLDGVPLSGTYPNINPRDVHFLAVLSPNQAQVQFGDRAPNGALVVYTRAYGDR